MAEWMKYPSNPPKEQGAYLCCALIPNGRGGYNKIYKVLRYSCNDRLARGFVCEDMIVTHWMPLPELPEVKLWD